MKVIVVLVPPYVDEVDSVVQAIHLATPERCQVAVIHELRPYPALVAEWPVDTLCELPGGVVDPTDSSVKSAALRELEEEFGSVDIIAAEYLLENPSPTAAGSQIEGYSLYAVAYGGNVTENLKKEVGITGDEVLPLVSAYHTLKARHEARAQCVDMKLFAGLLILQQSFADRYGGLLFKK